MTTVRVATLAGTFAIVLTAPASADSLHELAARGLLTADIKNLLSHGADPNARSALQTRAMHYAAAGGRADIITVLAAAQTDLEARDLSGAAPLHHAAAGGHVPAIRSLVEAGANVWAYPDPVDGWRLSPPALG